MGIFSNLFGGKQRSVMAQLPQVESAVGNCVADFKDRTKLSYALIFPIMLAVAVWLYVQVFGVEGTRQHFELDPAGHQVALLHQLEPGCTAFVWQGLHR